MFIDKVRIEDDVVIDIDNETDKASIFLSTNTYLLINFGLKIHYL